MATVRKLLIALTLALLLTLANMAASVFAGPGPTLPPVKTQRDCPKLNGETSYLYVSAKGQVVRCVSN